MATLKQVLRRLVSKPRIGLALGSGGARGLAHIPVLEALDEMDVKPAAVAGASIGAVVGAAYAAGMSGRDIRVFAVEALAQRSRFMRRLVQLQFGVMRDQLRDIHGFRPPPIQFDAVRIAQEFLPTAIPKTFEELKIPLTVVATDFWARTEVVFRSGPLRPPVAGSMAIPGLVRPVEFDGRVLIDGGAINPLPFDLLRSDVDIVIAVDITRSVDRGERTVPDPMECLFMASHIMTHAIVSEKLKASAPDILIEPKVQTFGALDFLRADPILLAAEPVKEEIKKKLGELLS